MKSRNKKKGFYVPNKISIVKENNCICLYDENQNLYTPMEEMCNNLVKGVEYFDDDDIRTYIFDENGKIISSKIICYTDVCNGYNFIISKIMCSLIITDDSGNVIFSTLNRVECYKDWIEDSQGNRLEYNSTLSESLQQYFNIKDCVLTLNDKDCVLTLNDKDKFRLQRIISSKLGGILYYNTLILSYWDLTELSLEDFLEIFGSMVYYTKTDPDLRVNCIEKSKDLYDAEITLLSDNIKYRLVDIDDHWHYRLFDGILSVDRCKVMYRGKIYTAYQFIKRFLENFNRDLDKDNDCDVTSHFK